MTIQTIAAETDTNISLNDISVRRDWSQATEWIVECDALYVSERFDSAQAAAEFIGLDGSLFTVVDNHRGYYFTDHQGLNQSRKLSGRDMDDRLTLIGRGEMEGVYQQFAAISGENMMPLVAYSRRDDI